MANFKTIGEGQARHFQITGGLQEGYGDDGQLHEFNEVIAAHHAWQQKNGFVLGALLTPNTVSYGWPKDGTIHCASESGWALSGGINVIYNASMSDAEVWERLESLASFVAEKLGQTRVYLSYAGVDRILQAEDKKHPRETTS